MHFGTTWLGAIAILLLGVVQTAVAQYRVEAIPGEPFGVGRIEVRLPEDQYSPLLGVQGLAISEPNGRVLYPAIQRQQIPGVVREIPGMVTNRLPRRGRAIGQLLGGLLDRPPTAVIYFLFQGTEPLEVTIQSTRTDYLTVPLRAGDRAYERLLADWWRQYTDRPGLLEHKDDYPPVVQNYMTATIARRHGLEPPAADRKGILFKDIDEKVGLSLVAEQVKIQFERRRILGDQSLLEPADQPLPAPIPAAAAPVPEVPDDVKIEPMAMHVPAECIYIRFGTFLNFLWLQDTLKTWGGDAQNLLSLRGLDYGMSRRMEEALILQQSAMARLLGPTVIEDVAIVGTDIYFQDGGCFGLLFHAKNNLVLGADFKRQRAERLQADKEVAEETVKIAGRDVSLLSTPDGRVRSFYAVDGMFHFVTRSRRLMERFLETGADQATALGSLPAFRHARHLFPIERSDTVFIYMSEPFFDHLVSPRYRIETRRRLQAIADIELVKLARLAARSEAAPDASIEALVKNGFLPAEFGPRPDGSRAVLRDGDVYDSLRGRRGAFLPILDVSVENVTATEAADYRQFVEYYGRNWGNLDPVVIGVQRSNPEKKLEKVVVDARMMPFSRSNFDRLQQRFGPADTYQLAPIPQNLGSFEAVLKDQRIFGGLQDVNPPAIPQEGGLLPGGIFRNLLVGYLGADGPLGPLGLLNFGLFSPTDPAGYARNALGGWRLSMGTFTLFSFQQQVLADLAPQLRYLEAEKPAQFRLDVGDVTRARIMPLLNDLGYARTAETSRGNLRLMHQLNQQLGVPVAECLATAEDILDARLICPLGGQYRLEESSGLQWWTSPALVGPSSRGLLPEPAPEGFVAPPLNWFRGLKAEIQILPETLNVHAEVLMLHPIPRPAPHESEDAAPASSPAPAPVPPPTPVPAAPTTAS